MSKSCCNAGERLFLLSESLIAERTDELSRPRIDYCERRPDQQLAQNIKVVVLRKWRVVTGTPH